eukprot:gene488-8002_t
MNPIYRGENVTPLIKSVFTFDNLSFDGNTPLSNRRPSFNRENEYARVNLKEEVLEVSKETSKVANLLKDCIDMRRKYVFQPNAEPKINVDEKVVLQCVNGVIEVFSVDNLFIKDPIFKAPMSLEEFLETRLKLLKIVQSGEVTTYTQKRIDILSGLYDFHQLLNSDLEAHATQTDSRDFFNITKVDNHVHLAAAMTGRHLLSFILKKLDSEPEKHVLKDKSGEFLCLKDVLEQVHPQPKDLTTDFLDCHADRSLFQRFDKFNAKYNPCGMSELRTIFMKSSNDIDGKYFGELTKEILLRNEKKKYCFTEYRLSIYGRDPNEWDTLAKWYLDNKLSSPSNKWMIQFPRIFDYLSKSKKVANFEEYLLNLFLPLFETTINPMSHPELAEFLKDVVAFDSCDDESSFEESPIHKHPKDWTSSNPCYAYYMYFTYANIYSLNKLRESRGLSTFAFRPHAGEAGSPYHLADCFLLANSINHGIQLKLSASLQYLYYLEKIGLSVSPLSNNVLFMNYGENPFYDFFKKGLNVTLSTDDPLQFHSTEQPLIEEYSAAAQIWKLTTVDMSEIARNSVLQSGFSIEQKKKWLGDEYQKPGIYGNDVEKSNIPEIRVAFRYDVYQKELKILDHYANYFNK